MTCIVGLCHKSKVYIGGDSASCGSHSLAISKVPKVFVAGEFAVGFTSSWRMGQILRYHVDYEAMKVPDDGLDKFMVCEVVEAVREAFKAYGYAKLENNVEEAGEFLVGCRGHLYHVESDYQVNETVNGLDACGAGEEYALGALYAMQETLLTAYQRIDLALEAAHEFCAVVRPPYRTVSV